MIDGLRPYAEMKPSGLPWLGHVPAHWEVRSLGSMILPRSERNRADLPLLSVVRERGVIARNSMSREENHNFVPDDLSNYKLVRRGDLVINKMKAWQGSLGIAPIDGIVSPAYFVYQTLFENPRFGQALLRSKPYIGRFAAASDGVRIGQWDLNPQQLKRIQALVPTPDEQRLIVRFLDWHGAQTGKLIRAKKKIIALLNEQKQAIIHRAVTRGLDPNARLKPSGIPWLGDVPEHWNIQSLGSMIKRRSARNRTDLPLLSVVRERGVILRSSMSDEENHNFVPDDLSNYKVALRGDLVINKMKAWQGSLGIAPCDGIVSPAYFVYELDIEDIAFGQMLLRSKSYVACFARVSDGVRIGQWDLSIDGMKRIPVLRPSRDEQIAIVEFVDRSTLELEKIKEFTLREIALIQEFRTRLIADVVTGKLDVRAAAASLPETVELEPIDDLVEGDDLDEAVDDAENEEVAA